MSDLYLHWCKHCGQVSKHHYASERHFDRETNFLIALQEKGPEGFEEGETTVRCRHCDIDSHAHTSNLSVHGRVYTKDSYDEYFDKRLANRLDEETDVFIGGEMLRDILYKKQDGMSEEEIASDLGIHVHTVQMYLSAM